MNWTVSSDELGEERDPGREGDVLDDSEEEDDAFDKYAATDLAMVRLCWLGLPRSSR